MSQKLFRKHHVWALNQEDARQKISAMLDGAHIRLIASLTSHQAGESKVESVQRDDGFLGSENSVRDPRSTSVVTRLSDAGQLKRSVATRAFADYVSDQIAGQRASYSIGDVFCAVMRQHHAVDGDTSLASWADAVTALITTDTILDSEEGMTCRATRAVLNQAFGPEMLVSGFPIEHTTED